jgi:hypothetical protein
MKRILLTIGVTACVATAGLVLAINTAQADTTPETDSQLVTPAVTNQSGQFFTAAQLQTVWSAVVKHYPDALAPGASFPAKPPAFFTPDSDTPAGSTVLYQSGLVDEIANNLYTCSWLSYDLANQQSGAASDVAKATSMLAKISTLPSASLTPDFTSQIKTEASQSRTTNLIQAQFAVECGS